MSGWGDYSSSLYDMGPAPSAQPEPAAPAPAAAAAPDPRPAAGSASDALVRSAELIAAPVPALVSEVLPLDVSQSKLPYGWAVFGACIAAMVWANSLDRKRK